MNAGQARRIGALGADSVWRIPEGSWLAVRRGERGTWVEVIEPECSGLLAFDFASDEQMRSRLPESEAMPDPSAERTRQRLSERASS